EGSVHVATNASAFDVNAGFQSNVEPDGSQKTRSIVPDREVWTAVVAPPFPIEGKSVAALLDWCSRESGLALRYADRNAEHIALTTLLHGSPTDLEPVEAAQAILPTAGLQAVPDRGDLVVRAGPALH